MRQKILSSCLFAALSASHVVSAEIYHWTDETGESHYSDRNPGAEANVETIEAATGSSSPVEREDYRKLNEDFLERRQAKLEAEEKARETAAETAKSRHACEQAQRRATSLERPRINQIDAEGNRTRMPEEWRQAQLTEARAAVEKLCK